MSLQPEIEPEDTPVPAGLDPVPFLRDDAPQDDYEEPNGTGSPIDEEGDHGVPV